MFAQACQDHYVFKLLPYPMGFFVDIGAGTCDGGIEGSNTYYFEKLGWNGIAIDLEFERISKRNCIKVAMSVGDGSSLKYILNKYNCPKVVDYLSIDVDGPDYTVLEEFIQAGYEFKVLTFEHDVGTLNKGRVEAKYDAFNLLGLKGYIRIVENVGNKASIGKLKEGYPFEDWYINPKYIQYKDALTIVKD